MRFNVQRSSKGEIEQEIERLKDRGFQQVSDIIEIAKEGKLWDNNEYRAKFIGWGFHKVYKVKMEGERVNVVTAVSELVTENEKLQEEVQKLSGRLSKKIYDHDVAREKLANERKVKKELQDELKQLKTALQLAQNEIRILKDNQMPPKKEVPNGKRSLRFKASIKYCGREMVLGYFNTEEEARKAELNAAASL